MSARTPKPAILVEPRSKGWAVQTAGAQRAASLHPTQAGAVAAARVQARRRGVELVIKGRDGTIQRKDSHGNDPARFPG